jgi:hypothetical protein
MADNELKIISAEQVALSLMRIISDREESDVARFEKPDARTYYLTLFHQCVRAGHGGRSMNDILKEESGDAMQPTSFRR